MLLTDPSYLMCIWFMWANTICINSILWNDFNKDCMQIQKHLMFIWYGELPAPKTRAKRKKKTFNGFVTLNESHTIHTPNVARSRIQSKFNQNINAFNVMLLIEFFLLLFPLYSECMERIITSLQSCKTRFRLLLIHFIVEKSQRG